MTPLLSPVHVDVGGAWGRKTRPLAEGAGGVGTPILVLQIRGLFLSRNFSKSGPRRLRD